VCLALQGNGVTELGWGFGAEVGAWIGERAADGLGVWFAHICWGCESPVCNWDAIEDAAECMWDCVDSWRLLVCEIPKETPGFEDDA